MLALMLGETGAGWRKRLEISWLFADNLVIPITKEVEP
jgi:hypothetical protein